LTGKKLNGYLDRLRENVATLDETLALARKMGKSKKAGDRPAAIQALKLIRDLAEVRNATLLSIKAHILGRDETGSVKEPANVYSGNAEVMFERDFKRLLEPWTLEDLKLECEDCGVTSEKVSTRTLVTGEFSSENGDLCDRCYAKRTAKDAHQPKEDSEASAIDSILKDAGVSPDSTMDQAVIGIVQNAIGAVTLRADSPLEKAAHLEALKANLVATAAQVHGSPHDIAPGLALFDKEIERLRAEAGKGQAAAGKPAT